MRLADAVSRRCDRATHQVSKLPAKSLRVVCLTIRVGKGPTHGMLVAPASFPFSRPAQPLGVGDAIKPIVIGTAIAPVDRIKRLAPTGKGAKGGERAYEGRLGKDRSRLQSPHSAASPD